MSILDDDYLRRLIFKYGEPLLRDELTDMISMLVTPDNVQSNVDRFLEIKRGLPSEYDVTEEQLSTYLQVCNIPSFVRFKEELLEETDLGLVISFVSWKMIGGSIFHGPSIYLISAEEWEREWERWNS